MKENFNVIAFTLQKLMLSIARSFAKRCYQVMVWQKKIISKGRSITLRLFFIWSSSANAEFLLLRAYFFKKELVAFSQDKDTILLVSSDASRTDGSILLLNICQTIREQYNIVVLLLKGGSLSPVFEQNCNLLISHNNATIIGVLPLEHLIRGLKKKYNINFSIINSIESHKVLKPLAENFIPSVLLVHEFFVLTFPQYIFIESLLWAGKTIFPAKIVQKNATNLYTCDMIESAALLPPGKFFLTRQQPDLFPEFFSQFDVLKYKSKNAKPFVILGVGRIHYSKGVDLFISVAADLKRLHSECNIKMIWLVENFEPRNDLDYYHFLSLQIDQLDLKDCCEVINEIANVEDLYEITDLFFLSSRLDPLPSRVIDTMLSGIPLICFEQGSGVVEFLEQDTDLATCIIPDMSINESVKRIMRFYHSSEYCSLISAKIKSLACKNFDMHNYIANLLDLSVEQSKVIAQEELDCKLLENSSDFKEDFFLPVKIERHKAIRQYVRLWHNKINTLRKPAPGFNSIVYDLYHNCSSRYVEPFADYIRSGKPGGPWQDKVIIPTELFEKSNNQVSCAIHIHAYYPDLLLDILKRLQLNHFTYDLFVSATKASEEIIRDILSTHCNMNYELKIVPNKGRDIGPFLTEFSQILQNYEVIGHFHTKKTLHAGNPELGKAWFSYLVNNLVSYNTHPIADQLIAKFEQETTLGLIFADDPRLCDWGKNKIFADKIARQLGISNLPENRFNFPVGTMFWVRSSALKLLFEMGWTWDLYPEEPLPPDGTELHAIERLIPFIVAHQGYTQAVTFIPGLTH